jgi:hypothetical protein
VVLAASGLWLGGRCLLVTLFATVRHARIKPSGSDGARRRRPVGRLERGLVLGHPPGCGELLSRAIAVLADDRESAFLGAAVRLVEALPGNPARPAVIDAWRREPGVEPGFIVDLLTALAQIDDALTGRAADHILAWPKTYSLDAVFVPAVRRLLGSSTIRGSAGVQRLRTACLDHLRARIAQPLEALKDWRRASALACSCRYCAERGHFLADPERRCGPSKLPKLHAVT